MNESTTSAPPTRLTWAQARLRLGITNVGFWVISALLVIALQPQIPPGALGWGLVVVVVAALQAPFDWVGGRLLPLRHHRAAASSYAIARGVLVQSAVWSALGLALMYAAPHGWWALAAVWVLSLALLVAAQAPLARVVAELRTLPVTPEAAQRLRDAGLNPALVRVLNAQDQAFVGGWSGLPGLERLSIPARWLSPVPSEVANVALVRRDLALRSGARTRGVAAALGWTVFGMLIIVAIVPGAGFDSPSALLATSAGATLWSFTGLLTLPRHSRNAVFALDRAAAEVVGSGRVAAAVARLDEDQENESERSDQVESVFHPVPSPTNRIRALRQEGQTPRGAWKVARTSLYLGWAQFSWLSRAVHCNAGRPELWVFFPGD